MKQLRQHFFETILLILLFVLLCAPVSLATTVSPYEPYAESLSELGVFLGTEQGFELNRAPTRLEGLVMLIRLLGAEEEAQTMKNAPIPFTDVPNWAHGYVAYGWKNQLTTGVSETVFGSENVIDARMFTTLLLRSLGYRDGAGDFSYVQAVNYARDLGLIDQGLYKELQRGALLRGHVAKMSYDALHFPYHGTNQILMEKLMAEGKIPVAIGNAFLANRIQIAPLLSGGDEKTVTEIAKNTRSIVMLVGEIPEGEVFGSGIILTADGTIATNYHVIEGVTSIQVGFDDGTTYTGPVLVQDYSKELDLAILKINQTGLIPVVLGDSDQVELGEKVVAIGSPEGLFNTVSEGIVSSLWSDAIQTTAAISHGSSGGALFNRQGQVIGITSSGILEGENLGFAIPVNFLEQVSGKKMLSLPAFLQQTDGGKAAAAKNPQTAMLYYSDADWVPDFGKLLGYTASYHNVDTASVAYAYENVSTEAISRYMAMLNSCGYFYDASLTTQMVKETKTDCVCFLDSADNGVVLAEPYDGVFMIVILW